jgi:hypothetical protein
MNAKLRLLIVVAGLAIPTGPALSGSPHGVPRSSGKVLILDNERAVEGDIALCGDQYCIRRGEGEISFPATKAVRLCADWDEALAFMKSRANLQDPDERLRLARWCQQQRLLAQALAEVKTALELRPAHAPARQLQILLQKEIAVESNKSTTTSPPPSLVAPPPPVDVGAESFALFSSKVHPILMNTCASCHAAEQGGNFHLLRAYEGGLRPAMQRNLAAVLSQIHMEQPALSPLLIKAASAHGTSDQPPLQGGRQSVPYKSLETWVQMVVANNPHLREQYARAPEAPAGKAMKTTPEPRALPWSVAESPMAEKPAPPPVRPVEHVATPSAGAFVPGVDPARAVPVMPQTKSPPATARAFAAPNDPPTAPSTSARTPDDPFDPAIFNELMHPKR